jgi:hypothetical protein
MSQQSSALIIPRFAAGCEGCRRVAREYERARRARRRGLDPEPPALVVVEPFGPDHDVVETPAAPLGAVELAVAVDLDKLGHLPAGSLAFRGGRAGDGAGDGRPRVTEFGLAAPAA